MILARAAGSHGSERRVPPPAAFTSRTTQTRRHPVVQFSSASHGRRGLDRDVYRRRRIRAYGWLAPGGWLARLGSFQFPFRSGPDQSAAAALAALLPSHSGHALTLAIAPPASIPCKLRCPQHSRTHGSRPRNIRALLLRDGEAAVYGAVEYVCRHRRSSGLIRRISMSCHRVPSASAAAPPAAAPSRRAALAARDGQIASLIHGASSHPRVISPIMVLAQTSRWMTDRTDGYRIRMGHLHPPRSNRGPSLDPCALLACVSPYKVIGFVTTLSK